MKFKNALCASSAAVALAVSLSAPAQAACVTTGDDVVCGDDVTAIDVETGIAGVLGTEDGVSVSIEAGAAVGQPDAAIDAFLLDQEMVFVNSGVIGTETDAVDVRINAFNDTTGSIVAVTLGGTLNGNLFVNGGADVDVAITGAANNVSLNSYDGSYESASSTETTAGVTTNTFEEAYTTAETGGVVLDVAATASTGSVNAGSNDDVTVAVAGEVDGSINASASGFQYTTDAVSVSDPAAGSSTSDYAYQQGNIARDASVDVAASGSVSGAIIAQATGDATVTNAGMADANVSAFANGSAYTYEQQSASLNAPDGTLSTSMTSFAEANSATGGVASVTNTGQVGATGAGIFNVNVQGQGGADFTNSGRVNANVAVNSTATDSTSSNANSSTTVREETTLDLISTSFENSSTNSSTASGGDASFVNEAGGLLDGNVNVFAHGDVTVDNAGAVTGNIAANAQGFDSTSSFEGQGETVYADDGSFVSTYANSSSNSNTASGGSVSGDYSGTVGAVRFAQVQGGTVTQNAHGDNTASVTGLILGNLNLNTGSFDNTGESTYEQSLDRNDLSQLDGDRVVASSGSNTSSTSAGTTAIAIDGGTVNGGVNASSAGGNIAIGLMNGAEVGSIYANSYGSNSESTSSTDMAEVYEDGTFLSGESVQSNSSSSTAASGAVDIAIGDAIVDGSVNAYTQAGGISLAIGPDGETGSVGLFSNGTNSTSESTGTTTILADDPLVYREITNSNSNSSAGGDIFADVGGFVFGNLNARTEGGDIAVSLTGNVDGQITAYSIGGTSTSDSVQTLAGVVTQTFEQTELTTSSNGDVSLEIVEPVDGSVSVVGGIYAIGGNIGVTIGEGARVATDYGDVDLTAYNETHGSTSTPVFTDGVLTGESFTSFRTPIAGDATLLNDGEIGAEDGNFADVELYALGNATVINNGDIYGDIELYGLGQALTYSYLRENPGDLLETRTNTNTYAPVGGDMLVDNAGMIAGRVELAGTTGAVLNDGWIADGIVFGDNVDNYETTSVDTFTAFGEQTVTEEYDPFVQSYTLEQNAMLGGGIYVEGAFGDIDPMVLTSAIDATLNLNDGSITSGPVVAEYDPETGDRFTATTLNLNGAGYLGLDSNTALALDPTGGLSSLVGATAVLGVETLNKNDEGIFLIHGAEYVPGDNDDLPFYTFDVGTLAINGGELQLSSNGGPLGLRGDLVNSASLVLGQIVMLEQPQFGSNLVGEGLVAVDGVTIVQEGNFTQTDTGTLTLGVLPDLVRVFPSGVTGGTSVDILGVQQIGVSQPLFTTIENAFGQAVSLDDSFVAVDGDLDLAGTVNVLTPIGGIYADGATLDIMSVTGTVTNTATVDTQLDSAFVSFGLTTRVEDGITIVSVVTDRTGYESVATNSNAAAAGAALTAAISPVVADLQADANGSAPFGSVRELALAQDMATLIAGFDSLLTANEVSAALNELASGHAYGSLAAIETTSPFNDALSNRQTAWGNSGFGLWIGAAGRFADFDGNSSVGSLELDTENYGASMGFSVQTGNLEFGLGGGYGHIEADTDAQPFSANADTWMVGTYAQYNAGSVTVGADLVFGWSDWDASRALPTLAREAIADFDSKELRFNLRGEYAFDFGGGFVAPFANLQVRRYDFDGFTEEGAGAVSLVVEGAEKTVFSPAIGLKAGTAFTTDVAVIRPEASLSYTFQGDIKGNRDVAYLGNSSQGFLLEGVDPKGFVTGTLGLFADIGANSGAFIRGSASTGGDLEAYGASVGVTIGF
ncbi:autotransporter domain-containing protein [Croceicoccus gelatinilyticus]|uniref:autotransporter domain-containing protein n=1 Tax=Croceicoccus gelatinilyticus TaxID=2835536 RepID=UPI001BCA9557|nr:autotransporter outer membrane beta-barrel domain-containing protein [Croceicoccus gelatinilyticus]MBS7671684.1 autotransporter domain-containing protein [Croceicoccus gelatinilyticus]